MNDVLAPIVLVLGPDAPLSRILAFFTAVLKKVCCGGLLPLGGLLSLAVMWAAPCVFRCSFYLICTVLKMTLMDCKQCLLGFGCYCNTMSQKWKTDYSRYACTELGSARAIMVRCYAVPPLSRVVFHALVHDTVFPHDRTPFAIATVGYGVPCWRPGHALVPGIGAAASL